MRTALPSRGSGWLALAALAYSAAVAVAMALDAGRAEGVLRTYRLVRSTSALLAGGILGMCGGILQAAFRNPLVDHYVLGIGSGALFAFYLSVLLLGTGVPSSSASVAGGLAALALAVGLANRLSGSDVSYVLSGLAVTSLFSGLSMLMSHFVARLNPYATLYLTGSFVTATGDKLAPLLAALAMSLAAYASLSKPLNALAVSDSHAKQLGYEPGRVRAVSSVVAGASSSLVVSLFGLLGFVGLVSPHISRAILKTGDSRHVLPFSFAVGSLLVYSTDLLSRYALVGVTGEVPAGAIASVIGAPFFIALLVVRFGGRAL